MTLYETCIESLAVSFIAFAARACIPIAPIPAASLFLALFANVGYVCGALPAESVRWVSAVVGLAGAVEFGRGVERMKQRIPVSIPDALRKVDAAAWIGLALLASMGVDGFGLLVFREFEIWIIPEMTIGILCLVIALGLFGRRTDDVERTGSHRR